ncbi:MAG: hydrogenase iron-sulfur subunit [Humidesulfovibrio sp.]|nr:hydrogenase iron-sulfur subunit [Humidesulfovibrio sp.]
MARFSQPTDLRIIRVPCSGRVDPMFVAKALLSGADGVLVSGCHPRDCHYSEGNLYARRRLEMLRRFLPILGVDEGRFEYIWVSASEGSRWRDMVTKFTDKIHALGPMPRMAEPVHTLCSLSGMLGQSLAQPDMALPDWDNKPDQTVHSRAVLTQADIAGLSAPETAKEDGNG